MMPSIQGIEHFRAEILNTFVDGEFAVEEQSRIQSHLRGCRLCSSSVLSARALKTSTARAGRNSRITLEAAIDRLEQRLREPLLLCDVEELSYKDVSLVLDIPVNVVTARISDARKALCHFLFLETGKLQ